MKIKYSKYNAITPILCKVFEYCFLDRFHTLLPTGDNQFGFKVSGVPMRYILVVILLITLSTQVAL